MSEQLIVNRPAPNTPYFTPAQIPAAGSAVDPQPDGRPIPKSFQPISIRGLTFHNRLWLSPLCQYSADNGKMTPWHMAHLGGILTRGPGLTFTEAAAVLPNGRNTSQDAGLWSDEQIGPLKQIVDFAHSQNQKIAVQLAHAGRKASTVAPWLHAGMSAPEVDGGWPNDVWGPSAVAYNEFFPSPAEATVPQIKVLVQAFVDAARRALTAGVDVLEIHGAHGFMISEFLSPTANRRTDNYGGSFENRVRLALEVVDAVRAVIPESMPLFFRVSATEWLEEVAPNEPSWTSADTVRLAPLLAAHGVDLLDVSSGGIDPRQKFAFKHSAGQAEFAHAVKASVKENNITVKGTDVPLLVSAVGGIKTGTLSQEVLDKQWADVIFIGRWFQQNPGLVWEFARELGVSIHNAHQIEWGFGGRGGAAKPRTEKGGHDVPKEKSSGKEPSKM